MFRKILTHIIILTLTALPVQVITASVSNCMDSNKAMHHQMNGIKMVMSSDMDMTQSDSQSDCCEQTACDMTHCASSTAAAITSNTQNDMTYIVSNVYLKPAVSLIAFYPSSLYRPPKL